MKSFPYILLVVLLFASCKEGGSSTKTTSTEELTKLKKERADIDLKIHTIEAANDTGKKPIAVSAMEVQPTDFIARIDVQGNINGDQNVMATSQGSGTVKRILVSPGQHVRQGQVLAVLDATTVEQQLGPLGVQINLAKTLYEKQQSLWAQNVGTQVQLLTAKANYEGLLKNRSVLEAQRALFTIKSPINGTVDAVNIKVGDMAMPGLSGIKVVSTDKLKAEGFLGQNYLGKVRSGDDVILEFTDIQDTIKTKLTYVAEAVDPTSRSFLVQVRLGANNKLHPNMSCKMKIASYENKKALTVPVNAIQKTSGGDVLFIADNGKARAANVTTGHSYNGQVEIVQGLNPGDKVITQGYEELDNGEAITIE